LTIEELPEIEEIKNVRIMYSHHFDSGDIDSLAAPFYEDAICEFGEAYGVRCAGRGALAGLPPAETALARSAIERRGVSI
jgi:hypothetical protein